MSEKTFLVIGATGQQGGAVVKSLLSSGTSVLITIIAVTRNPESSSAKALIAKGVKVIKGDLNNVPALFANALKVLPEGKTTFDGAFFVTVSFILCFAYTADLFRSSLAKEPV
jgi:nucleoside-diphosphate-sugar epimerase